GLRERRLRAGKLVGLTLQVAFAALALGRLLLCARQRIGRGLLARRQLLLPRGELCLVLPGRGLALVEIGARGVDVELLLLQHLLDLLGAVLAILQLGFLRIDAALAGRGRRRRRLQLLLERRNGLLELGDAAPLGSAALGGRGCALAGECLLTSLELLRKLRDGGLASRDRLLAFLQGR